MKNEENKSLNEVISDFQKEMFDKGRFYQSEMAQYLMQLSFERCAQWKDEQIEKEKQALIAKACEWLKENALKYDIFIISRNHLLADFENYMNKQMKETK